jgi:hypothetical protein
MKRLGILVLALAGLTTLFASCGGGGDEEISILAVAFRLDEGSPVMSAYIGDPAQDPFQLPVGRYYIEALDEGDVLISLGAVDIEEGDVVEIPSSFAAAGGVADPQAAESLITLASFLIDVELAKYEFLEVVTGGFSESPFDPVVELDDASVQQLFEMYGEIATQEDVVLAALSEIESRVGVSSGASYVCSSCAFAPDDLDRTEMQVAFLVALLMQAQAMGEVADSPGEACQEGACWVIPLEADRFDADLGGQTWIRKTPETLAMFDEWQEYASKLVQDLGLTPDKTSSDQARKELTEKVRSDLQKWAPACPPELIEEAVSFFVNEVAKAVPELASAPAPGPGQAKPDTSWIEGLVQKVADKLLEEGHSGIEVASLADDLNLCLTEYVEQGLSQEDATAVCVWIFDKLIAPALGPAPEKPAEPEPEEPAEPEPEELAEPEAEEPAEPEAEEPAEPEAEEPAEPEAEEPAEPEPEEPAEPEPEEPAEPEPEDVTAVGQYTSAQSPGYVVVKNTMTLTFNTAGGLVKGDGEKDVQTPDDQGCGTGMIYGTYEYEGTYYPETNTFEGTFTVVGDGYFMSRSSDCDFVDGELVCECKSVPWGDSFSGDWQAALEDGVVKGSQTVQVDTFELTVQG